MTTNPFMSQSWQPLTGGGGRQPRGKFVLPLHDRRFLKRVAVVVTVFLVLVFFIFREIHASQQLYQMGLAQVDIERQLKESQEQLRVSEQQKAVLVAQLQQLQAQARTAPKPKAPVTPVRHRAQPRRLPP